METTNYKFCPWCKLANPEDAILCEHCGKPFESTSETYLRTTQVNRETKILPEELGEKAKERRPVPAAGMAIYVLGQEKPLEVVLEKEFIIGRLVEGTEEKVIDLTLYDAFALGVSRRHLMIQRTATGYEVIDLASRNGTWVDDLRLPPQSPFPVKSGSQIRLGNLRIVVVFRPQDVQEKSANRSS